MQVKFESKNYKQKMPAEIASKNWKQKLQAEIASEIASRNCKQKLQAEIASKNCKKKLQARFEFKTRQIMKLQNQKAKVPFFWPKPTYDLAFGWKKIEIEG